MLGKRSRPLKRPWLQTFVEEPEPIAIPQQELHAIAPPIDENVHVAAQGILLQGGSDQTREEEIQPVERVEE